MTWLHSSEILENKIDIMAIVIPVMAHAGSCRLVFTFWDFQNKFSQKGSSELLSIELHIFFSINKALCFHLNNFSFDFFVHGSSFAVTVCGSSGLSMEKIEAVFHAK
jgi:hypothetical protein